MSQENDLQKKPGEDRHVVAVQTTGANPVIPDQQSQTAKAATAVVSNKPKTNDEKLAELARRREAKEIAAEDYNINNFLLLITQGEPVTRQRLEENFGEEERNAALVLTFEDFDAIGGAIPFDVILASGDRLTVDPDDFPKGHVFIFYPDDLGN